MDSFHTKLTSAMRRMAEEDSSARKMLSELHDAIEPNLRNNGYSITDKSIEVKGKSVCTFEVCDGQYGIYVSANNAIRVIKATNLDEATSKLAELTAAALHRKEVSP